MPKLMYCPYFATDYREKKGRPCIGCEMGRVEFKNHRECREFVARYCGNEQGWKDCTIAQKNNKHYEEVDNE